MLSIFLRRIKKKLKSKAQNTATGNDTAGQTETGVPADTEPSDNPDMGSAGDRLSTLLKIIRDNAEFLKIMYGDSLPVKNIISATNQAMDAARLEKQSPSNDDCCLKRSPVKKE